MNTRAIARGVVHYIKHNSTIKWMVIPLLFYAALAVAFPADFLIKWLSWVLVVVAAGVCATYAIAVWHGLVNNGPMPRYTHLALGIFIGWLSIVMNRTWAGMIRLYPLEMWMRESYFIAFYVWTSIMAAVFHMTAPGAINGVVPTASWIKIGVGVMVGIMLGIAVGIALAGTGSAAIDFDLWSYLIRFS